MADVGVRRGFTSVLSKPIRQIFEDELRNYDGDCQPERWEDEARAAWVATRLTGYRMALDEAQALFDVIKDRAEKGVYLDVKEPGK